jgi:peptidoglycan/LPS O-acetylase OafA/YrhL
VNGAAHRPQLDALRALAVFTVLADHFWAALPSFGQLAVQLFFVLSGFLITSQLLDAGEALGASPAPQARRRLIGHFVARRALRIFPAYYALLLLLFVVDAPGVRRDIVALAAYATNWLQALRNDWALACAALVQAAARGIGGRVGAVLEHRVLVALGRISYGIYLYHLAVYWAITRVLERAGLAPPADGPVKLLVCGTLTVAVAALSWRVLEQPLQRLKRHFPWPTAAPRG